MPHCFAPVFTVFCCCVRPSVVGGAFEAYYEALNSPAAREMLGAKAMRGNVLILDYLALRTQYRGRGLGLRVMRQLMVRFGAGAEVIAIRPTPLQFDDGRLGEA